MGLFKSKKLVNNAGSGSGSTAGNPGRGFGSWLSKKGQKTQPDAGPIPSSAADNPTQRERCEDGSKAAVPNHHTPKDQEEMHNVRSLWDCAYDAFNKENPQLMTKYKRL